VLSRYCEILLRVRSRRFLEPRPPFFIIMAELFLDAADSLKIHCSRAFKNADIDSKGYLTREDYKVAVLELCGYKPSKYELQSVWAKHAGESGMSEETFVKEMTKTLKQKDADELIRQIFVSFDVHLNGFVTLDGCLRVFKEVAPSIKDDHIKKWFREVDNDLDGRVTYRDFELMMKSYVLLTSPH